MNQPHKFTIKKPRITLSEEQKKQARSGMPGEMVKDSIAAEPAPVNPEPVPAPDPANVAPAEAVSEPTGGQAKEPNPDQAEFLTSSVGNPTNTASTKQGRGGRGRKAGKYSAPAVDDSDTQHVRMSKDAVLRAKMNVLLLPPSLGIRSLRDYGDAAFEFYEAHLRKTGKLPNI